MVMWREAACVGQAAFPPGPRVGRWVALTSGQCGRGGIMLTMGLVGMGGVFQPGDVAVLVWSRGSLWLRGSWSRRGEVVGSRWRCLGVIGCRCRWG